MKSKNAMCLVEASERGYRVDEHGKVVSHVGKILKLNKDTKGYLRFGFNSANHDYVVSVWVHRLVAYQKFGDILFEEDMVVRHLDGNPANNSWDNIEIGTQSDNMMDRPEDSRRAQSKHAASFRRKLTEEEVAWLRHDRELGMSYKELMAKYGIAKSTVSYIVNRKTYN